MLFVAIVMILTTIVIVMSAAAAMFVGGSRVGDLRVGMGNSIMRQRDRKRNQENAGEECSVPHRGE